MIARVGGDEFLVVDTSSGGGYTHAGERLRTAIAAMTYPITASIGIAEIAIADIDDDTVKMTFDDLAAAADRLMYEAKRAGGNKIRRGRIYTATERSA